MAFTLEKHNAHRTLPKTMQGLHAHGPAQKHAAIGTDAETECSLSRCLSPIIASPALPAPALNPWLCLIKYLRSSMIKVHPPHLGRKSINPRENQFNWFQWYRLEIVHGEGWAQGEGVERGRVKSSSGWAGSLGWTIWWRGERNTRVAEVKTFPALWSCYTPQLNKGSLRGTSLLACLRKFRAKSQCLVMRRCVPAALRS